jgi:alpha-glucosidase (family GH31 glycosyl hydrolase)
VGVKETAHPPASLAAQNRSTGMPILRAMVLEFPDDTSAQTLNTQYMFGPGLLVAPVVTQAATSRSVYLPAGRWLDYNDRATKYAGPATVTAAAALGTVPVFVREGAIIPRGDILQTNNNWSPVWAPALRVEFFPAATGTTSFSYFDGNSTSAIACSTAADGIHIAAANLPYAGTLDVYCTQPTSITLNGNPVTNATYDAATSLLRIPYTAGPVTLDLAGSASIWP